MRTKPLSAHIVEVAFVSGPFDNQKRAEVVIKNSERGEITIEMRIIVPAIDAEQFQIGDVFALTLKRLP